jgi:hypothetical protein
MAATLTRSTRDATAEDIRVLERQAGVSSTLRHLLLMATALAAGAFVLGRFLGGVVGGVVVAILVLGFFGWAATSFLRFHAPIRKRVDADLRNRTVEILDISGAQPFTIPADHSSVDPAFAIELDGNRTLILVGQWLREPRTFGGSHEQLRDGDDEGDRYANVLPPPYAFPTSAFTVHRFPVSGVVVRIDIKGDYVAPAELVPQVELRKGVPADSHVLECPVRDLGGHFEAMKNE